MSALLSVIAEPLVAEPDAPLHRVPEAVVQDAWARRLYDSDRLVTIDGQPVVVLDPGQLNRGSGPDFSQASVRIGTAPEDLLWVGDVEIHRSSADWNRHKHGDDPAYSRVVLHVVLSPDGSTGRLLRSDGSTLPELVLFPYLDRSLRALIHDFYSQPDQRAPQCAPRWNSVPVDVRRAYVRQHGAERLREKAQRLGRAFGHAPNLDSLLIRGVFRALGYAPNADAMERLASRLPLALARRLDDPADAHALLVGLAGLADSRLFGDELHERYDALSAAHDLSPPMAPEAWRHGGRPANSPRQRLAQVAAMLGSGGLLRDDPLAALRAALGAADPVHELRERLRASAVPNLRGLGAARADKVLMNAVLPVLFLDAELREDLAIESQVLAVMDALPPEADRITRGFADAGLEPESALESQGIHHLAATLCDEGRCARCAIGQRMYPALAT